MSDISSILPYYGYNYNPAQNNSQTANNPNSSEISSANPSTIENNLIEQNITTLLQSIPNLNSSSTSLESLSVAVSNLQAVESAGILQSNPTLAQTVLNSTSSTPSLESLSSTLFNLQAFENAESAYNSNTTTPQSNAAGSSVNKTA